MLMQLPTEYFCTVLGRWRKYSCCLYRTLSDSLDEAEENMLGVHLCSQEVICYFFRPRFELCT